MDIKTRKTLNIAVGAVMALLIVLLTAAGVLMLLRMSDMNRQLAAMTEAREPEETNLPIGEAAEIPENDAPIAEEEATRENDVLIAGAYMIRSTTAISDAYRTGSDAGLSDDERETLEMAGAVLEEIITDGMTDYEKEKAVFDWMVSHLGYDEGALTVVATSAQEQAEPHGVLKTHTAVCVGYATTFRLFMEMLDIPCMVVHNNEAFHTWDLVQIDGAWYHVDVYGAIGGDGYRVLNQPDAMMMQGEDWDTEFYPKADSLDYNYGYRNAVRPDSLYDLPQALRQSFADGGNDWTFVFRGDPTETQVMISELQYRSNAAYADMGIRGRILTESSRCVIYDLTLLENGEYLLSVRYYSSEPNEGSYENVDFERIEQSITDAFGEGGISVGDYRQAEQ